MSFNASRACRCGHRHYPGKCPVRICGCTVLRPDPGAGAEDQPEDGKDTAAEETARVCICIRFSDTGGFRIADLCCPVHGAGGTEPGDGYWDAEGEAG